MKTHTWLLFLPVFLLVSTSVEAQFIKCVGIKAGVAISNIRATDVKPQGGDINPYTTDIIDGNVVSPAVSLFADFLHGDTFGLQADLTYLRKGASRSLELAVTNSSSPDGTGEVHEITMEYSLHYLEFALAAQPKLPLGDAVLYAQIGPTASYLLDVSNFAWLDQFNRFQLGYILGIGGEVVHIFNGGVFIEIRYAGDFSPFYEQTNAKLWNRSWTFCLGTSF